MGTLQDLAENVINTIQNHCGTIYVVSDTYETDNINASERQSRGSWESCILNIPDMKLPYDANKYLPKGEHIENLFKLIRPAIKTINTRQCWVYLLPKKWSFPLRISSVNVSSFLKFNGKLYFLCVVIFPLVTVSRSNKTMNTLIQICTAITRKQIQS